MRWKRKVWDVSQQPKKRMRVWACGSVRCQYGMRQGRDNELRMQMERLRERKEKQKRLGGE